MFATNIAASALSLGNVLVVARTLGPGGRGQVVFLTTVAALAANLAMFGVQEANVNFAGSDPGTRRSLATNSVILAALFGLALAALVAGLMRVFPALAGGSPPLLRWFVLSSVPVLVLQYYLRLLMWADYRFAASNVVWLLGPVVNVSGNGLFALAGHLSVASAVVTWVGGQALGTVLAVWFIARRMEGFGRADLALGRRTLAFGLRNHVGRIFGLGNFRLDHWFLGALRPARDLGLYNVAVAWSEFLFYLPSTVRAVLRPDLVRASDGTAAERTAPAFRAVTLLMVPLAAGMTIVAPVLCVTVFGGAFHGSIGELRALVPGAFGIVALSIFGNTLSARGKPGLESLAISFGFVATVILDLILIPPYGAMGAAVASSIAYTIAGMGAIVIFVVTFRRDRGPGDPAGDVTPDVMRPSIFQS